MSDSTEVTPLQSRRLTVSSIIVGTLTMLSRILGLVRDKLLMVVLGAWPWASDAFFLAFTIPNLSRRILGEGALASALLPTFIREYDQSKERGASLASTIISLVIVVTGGLIVLGLLIALIGYLIASTPQTILFFNLLATMLPYMCFICVSAIQGAILNSLHKFTWPALMSSILNLALIAGCTYLICQSTTDTPPDSVAFHNSLFLALIVTVSGLLQVIIVQPTLWINNIRIRWNLNLQDPAVKTVLTAFWTAALGLGIVQLNVLCDNLIAYFWGLSAPERVGANTYLYLSNRLMQLPLGIFAIAAATTAFPVLTRQAASNDIKGFLTTLNHSGRLTLYLVIAAAAGLIACSDPLIRLIYQDPNLVFTDTMVYRTQTSLCLYAAGLGFFAWQMLLVKAFHARGNFAAPVKIAVICAVLNLILNLLFLHLPDQLVQWRESLRLGRLDADFVPILGESGLALATSVSALVQCILLQFKLYTELKPQLQQTKESGLWADFCSDLGISTFKIVCGAAVMGVFVYLSANSIPAEPEFTARLIRCVVVIILGILGYAVISSIIPLNEYYELWNSLFKKKSENSTK